MSGPSRFAAAAAGLGLSIEVRSFGNARTAVEAAEAVGVEVGKIVKSLVFLRGSAPVLVLASGPNRVDEGRLGVTKASADVVREATGYAIGGVPPFGHATPLETTVDEDLLRYDVVWAAAGRPDEVFAIAPAKLVEVTGGRVSAIA